MKTCWIIGASNGIGRELAIKIYRDGYNVVVSARNEEELECLKRELNPSEKSKKQVLVLPLDVSKVTQLKKAQKEIVKNFGKIDLAIFSPAIYKQESILDFDLKHAQQTMDINFGGCLNFLHNIVPQMTEQKMINQTSGHIVLIASVAGYRGLPNSLAYGASKAAMINLAESIYPELKANHIDLSIVNPGFVDTRLTKQNKFKMPFLMSEEKAAQEILKGIKKKKFEIHFPKVFTVLLKLLSILPYKLYFFLTKKLV